MFLFFLLFLIAGALASPIALNTSASQKRAQSVFIGYNGFSGDQRPPQASAGGELGAVFYIADAVDLAKAFAKGADPKKDTNKQSKVWVPTRIISQGAKAVNNAYIGSVIFAPHTTAGLPDGHPAAVYQLGIRQAQIAGLKITMQCHPTAYFANDHHTLNYPSLDTVWKIQRPQ